MQYDYQEIKVPHFELKNDPSLLNSYIDMEHFPRYELYPDKLNKDVFKLMIRWTFRIFIGKQQILGYISEQDFIIKYKSIDDNLERLRLLFGTSLLTNQLEFDNLKQNTILTDFRIPNFQITDLVLQEILDTFEQATHE